MIKSISDRHFRSIDFLKGSCILFVILTHYAWSDAERLSYLFPFWIDMAVPVFMVISGFVGAKSFHRRGIDTFEKAYKAQTLCDRFVRYTVPLLFALLVEEVVFLRRSSGHSISQIFWIYLVGGQGPGSYYYPCMIQFIFLFPAIFFIVRKHGQRGLLLCGMINIVYELLKTAYGIDSESYRLLVFRYILVISYGCYLATSEEKKTHMAEMLLSLTGIAYVLVFVYMGRKPIITEYWTGTSFAACLWILPILKKLIQSSRLRFRPLELLGKASYHIYLTQMVYYRMWAALLYEKISSRSLQIVLSLVICLLAGILFYWFETPITKLIVRKIKTIGSK